MVSTEDCVPRVEGSNPGFSLSFIRFPNQSRRSVRHRKKRKCTIWPATKRVASAGAANRRRRTARRFRNGHEKRFGSFEQRLNGERRTRNDMERKIVNCNRYIYNVPVTEKYSNIRPSEVDYIKKKIYIFVLSRGYK